MKQKIDQAMDRRNFLRLAGTTAIATASVLVLPGCSPTINPAAYRYWQQKTKGSMTDLQYLVMCATLAPSPHNTQPWKFQIQKDSIRVYADLKRHLGSADAQFRMMQVGIGCALENITIAAQQLGYAASIDELDADRQFASNGYCATVRLSRTGTVNHPLFDAIFSRQTTRNEFDTAPVPVALTNVLNRQANLPNVHLTWFSSPQAAAGCIDVSKQSVREFLKVNSRHVDGMKWFRIKRAEWESKRDGIAIFNSGAPAYVQQWVNTFTSPADTLGDDFKQGEIDAVDKVAPATALWGLVYADQVSPNNRIQAGRMAERVYLEATARGYSVQPVCYPTEITESSNKLKSMAGLAASSEPLFLFRLGKSSLISQSVRRDISEVLVS